MCGILLHKKNGLKYNEFENSLNMLDHRGPDGKNIIEEKNLYIGHTRLSIIDLSKKGLQPMISNCKNYIMSFNGEIYNYKNLRNELLEKGYKFRSETDSEVILNGYIEYKEKIFKKLDGIFAIVIYDKKNDIIITARDSFGVKPLYYFISQTELIISSEVRVFESSKTINKIAEILFLSHGYIPHPFTMYEEVFSHESGSYSIINNSKITFHKFFDLKNIMSGKRKRYFNKELLLDAVKKQLVSDAKTGCFLSGGVDSSILTLILNQQKKNIETYSINFSETQSEKKFQDYLIRDNDLNNISKEINYEDFEENFNDFLKSMDQPTIDGFNTYIVSKLARENKSKVTYSGVGSDEIFYGYPTFKSLFILKVLNLIVDFIPISFLPNKFKKIDYLKLGSSYGFYLSKRAIFSIHEISKILKISQNEIKSVLNNLNNYNSDLSNFNLLDKMAYYEIKYYMEGQLLKDADIFGMANSIEIRVPFLDIDVVKDALSINSHSKIRSSVNKIKLIENFKNELPENIYSRKKIGFELPFKNWIKIKGINKKIAQEYGYSSKKENIHWSKIWALYILKLRLGKN